MQTTTTMLGSMFVGPSGSWEVVMILAVVLVLFGARKIPEIMRGLKAGGFHFWQSLRQVFDSEAHTAGRSLGGIYGKRTAQALTPDNQTAELYDPAVFQEKKKNGGRSRLLQFWSRLWRTIHRWVGRDRRLRE